MARDPDRHPIIVIAAVTAFFCAVANCHPQCLDFRAPFKPEDTLQFCSQYSDLGCCGSPSDDRLKEEYEYIKSQATSIDWDKCHSYVKELLCQKCSPFAAHIYDAEGESEARKFPGLCTNYCHKFYDECRSMVWFLDPLLSATKIFSTREGFCDHVSLTDVDYCYPSLLNNSLLTRELRPGAGNTATPGCLCLEELRDDLANPLWARHAGDGSGRLFVAEQVGRVRTYNTQTKEWNDNCFIDFTDKAQVSSFPGDERGFLGLAFHPQYATNGRLFVYYVTRRENDEVLPPELEGRPYNFNSKVRISELRRSENDPEKVDMRYERVILDVPQPFFNHNGGELMFGIDGYLYAFIGDGGGAGDPMKAGQNKSLLHGKVIRIDVDSDPSQPYTIPADNPFVGEQGTKPEIFAYGVRNIWRCGMDRGDRQTGENRGRVLCGDVGQNAWEEIDVLKKGVNYGWPAYEGFSCYNQGLCDVVDSAEAPIHAYPHSDGKSVTGGVFYRGCESPALDGQYIYGDYTSSRLFSLTESGGVWTNKDVNLCGPTWCQGHLVGSLNEYILSFGEDENGEIYVLTSPDSQSSRRSGKVYKVVDPSTRNDPTSCNVDLTQNARVPLPKRNLATNAGDSEPPSATPAPKIFIRVRIRRPQGPRWRKRNRKRQRQQRRRRKEWRNAKAATSNVGQQETELSQASDVTSTDKQNAVTSLSNGNQEKNPPSSQLPRAKGRRKKWYRKESKRRRRMRKAKWKQQRKQTKQ